MNISLSVKRIYSTKKKGGEEEEEEEEEEQTSCHLCHLIMFTYTDIFSTLYTQET